MLIPVHADITRHALEKTLTPKVLETVIQANKKQDAIIRQVDILNTILIIIK